MLRGAGGPASHGELALQSCQMHCVPKYALLCCTGLYGLGGGVGGGFHIGMFTSGSGWVGKGSGAHEWGTGMQEACPQDVFLREHPLP